MGNRNGVRIRDNAKASNLSTSTKPNALIGPGAKQEQTLSNNRQVAGALGYRRKIVLSPEPIGTAPILGSLVTHLNTTIASCVLSGTELAAAQMGYSLLIHQSMNNPELRNHNLKNLMNHNVQGVVVTSSYFQESESLDQLTALDVPVVVVEASSLLPSRPKKKITDFENAHELTTYLIEKGCRRIAYVSGDVNMHRHSNLLSGCRDALLQNKLSEPETCLLTDYDGQNPWPAIDRMLLSVSSHLDGILFSNNVVTALAFAPREASALNDNRLMITWRKPSVASQNQVFVEIGKLAATLLIHLSKRKITSLDLQ